MPDTLRQLVPRITRYTINVVPEHMLGRGGWLYAVHATETSPGRWCVFNNGQCLSSQGEWSAEPLNSSKDAEWRRAHVRPRP
jgi:hypothetical protein